MKFPEIHIHLHNHIDCESLGLIKEIHVDVRQTKELVMALSAKMQEFVDASNAAFAAAADSLANISADIQRLLDGGSLSTEDAAALDAQLTALNTLKDNLATAAAVVPEP